MKKLCLVLVIFIEYSFVYMKLKVADHRQNKPSKKSHIMDGVDELKDMMSIGEVLLGRLESVTIAQLLQRGYAGASAKNIYPTKSNIISRHSHNKTAETDVSNNFDKKSEQKHPRVKKGKTRFLLRHKIAKKNTHENKAKRPKPFILPSKKDSKHKVDNGIPPLAIMMAKRDIVKSFITDQDNDVLGTLVDFCKTQYVPNCDLLMNSNNPPPLANYAMPPLNPTYSSSSSSSSSNPMAASCYWNNCQPNVPQSTNNDINDDNNETVNDANHEEHLFAITTPTTPAPNYVGPETPENQNYIQIAKTMKNNLGDCLKRINEMNKPFTTPKPFLYSAEDENVYSNVGNKSPPNDCNLNVEANQGGEKRSSGHFSHTSNLTMKEKQMSLSKNLIKRTMANKETQQPTDIPYQASEDCLTTINDMDFQNIEENLTKGSCEEQALRIHSNTEKPISYLYSVLRKIFIKGGCTLETPEVKYMREMVGGLSRWNCCKGDSDNVVLLGGECVDI